MNPFLLWSRLAWKTAEMATGAAQVIGHRTHRMAVAGPLPSTRDQREFTLMGREKGEAAMESARAMGTSMLALNQQFAALAFKQMLSASAALMSIASSRSVAQSAGRQSRLVRDMTAGSVAAAARLSGSTARVARRGLKPVHKRVSGNVRRLGKR